MKTTLTIAAIAMFAVVLGMSALSPALAAKMDKIDVCHFAEEEIEIDPETGEEIVIPAEWKVININGNAEKAHVGKHTDGENFDEKITEEFTVEDCLARNVVADPEPIPEEPTA